MNQSMVYAVGRCENEGKWELCGVYSTQEKAVAACKDYRYFVGPLPLDFDAERPEPWPGVFFPHPNVDEPVAGVASHGK